MSEFVRIIDPSGKTLRNDLYNSPPDAHSYIIFKKGNKTYAKNGMHGHIEYADTDAATVFQDVIDAIPDQGGKIYIKAGTYKLSTGLTIDRYNITLEGECQAISGNGKATTLEIAEPINVITITGKYCGIRNLVINGKSKAINGVTLDNTAMCTLENMLVISCTNYGIESKVGNDHYFKNVFCEYNWYENWYIHGSHYNITLVYCTAWGSHKHGFRIDGPGARGIQLIGCRAGENAYSGFYIYNTSAHEPRVTINGGYSWKNKQHGIYLLGAKHTIIKGVQIIDNSQEANDTYDGIRLSGFNTTYSEHNIIADCIIMSQETKKQRYGVAETDANQDYNLVHGCIVYGNATGQISLQGANSVQADNITA